MEPLGIYVHWPFCASKCPYCDFNSHVRETVEHARWQAALLRELEHSSKQAPKRHISSIFFGGGTPSLMPPATIAAVIEQIESLWGLDDGVEITLEANPTSVETRNFRDLSQAGINRISLGVQSLNDEVLRFLGRDHDARQAIAAIETAANLFGRYSFDLIYARPEQDLLEWRSELDRALAFTDSHISLYQLTIERGTPFHGAWRQGRLTPLTEEYAAEMFVRTREWLKEAGLPDYETSNHAAPGAECRHNLLYWRYGDYIGIGPGAHGRFEIDEKKHAVERRKNPERWLAAVERDGHGTRNSEPLDHQARLAEMVIMGLRLREGIPADRFPRETGLSMAACLADGALETLIEARLLEDDSSILRATEAGHLYLNAVIERLLP